MRWALVVMALSFGCVQSNAVSCGDYVCPAGNVCVAGGCATPEEAAACVGAIDGTPCTTSLGAGDCQGGACRRGLCGNGVVDTGEVCDDGNQVSGDGCRADCGKIEMCGDAIVDTGESCDDGNTNPADGCDACTTTAWTVSVVVGSTVAATDLDLNDVGATAFDTQGRMYIADELNDRVLRVELDGTISTVAGTGQTGFSGDGGPAGAAQLNTPRAVAIDSFGRLLIADQLNHRIRRVDGVGIITTIAGTGVAGTAGDGGPATAAQLSNPWGIALDRAGQIYFSDSGSRIRKIDLNGTITTFAGTTTQGFVDNVVATSGQLKIPAGIAFDSMGRLVIADSFNQRVRRVDTTVNPPTISTIAGTGIEGYTDGAGVATAAELDLPYGVAVDSTGNIYVAESVNELVRKIAPNGAFSIVAGVPQTTGAGGDGGPATSALLAGPSGVSVDSMDRVVIADTLNFRIRRVAAGTISTIAGTGAAGFADKNRAATATSLANPHGAAIDPMGHVVIVDSNNNRIWRIETDGSLTSIAGNGAQDFTGDGGPATEASLFAPVAVAFDPMGRMLIADQLNNRIRRVDTNGTITTVAGGNPAANVGDGGAATDASLDLPDDVAVDSAGNIFIADTYHNRIRRVDTSGIITTVAGTGTGSFSGDTGLATAATLNGPGGIAIDGTGQIVIADTQNCRIRRIDTTGHINTIAGTGTCSYTGDGGQATSATVSIPNDVDVDPTGRIVIADTGNNRVRRIATDGVISLVAGNGTQGNFGDGAAATSAELSGPYGVASDATGVYIVDVGGTSGSLSGRIRYAADGAAALVSIAGGIDPPNPGPALHARLATPQALVATSALSLVANGTGRTLELVRAGHVDVVAGAYPQSAATTNLARYQTSTFGTVSGVAYDGASTIYISETSANRIHKITMVDPANPKTWTITAYANLAGTAGALDGAVGSAELTSPRGLYFDQPSNTLYVADTLSHSIRAINLTTNLVTTVVNSAHRIGFDGDGGPAANALLASPEAVTKCGTDLFIADTGNLRVRRVDSAGTITTVLGTGVADSSGDGSPSEAFPVDRPFALACDATGNLFVTSRTTVRVVLANASGTIDGLGETQTIYGANRTSFPAASATCLSGLAVVDATTVQVADACTGLLVALTRTGM